MVRGIGESISSLFTAFAFCVIGLVIFVPLGIWKLIDIVIWMTKNIHIHIGG